MSELIAHARHTRTSSHAQHTDQLTLFQPQHMVTFPVGAATSAQLFLRPADSFITVGAGGGAGAHWHGPHWVARFAMVACWLATVAGQPLASSCERYEEDK